MIFFFNLKVFSKPNDLVGVRGKGDAFELLNLSQLFQWTTLLFNHLTFFSFLLVSQQFRNECDLLKISFSFSWNSVCSACVKIEKKKRRKKNIKILFDLFFLFRNRSSISVTCIIKYVADLCSWSFQCIYVLFTWIINVNLYVWNAEY